MKKVLFIISLLPFLLSASEFTGLKDGEKIKALQDDGKISVIIFSDYNTCMACNTNLAIFTDLKKEFPSVNVTLLLANSSSELRTHVKKIYELNYEVEQDHYGLMEKTLKVRQIPVYFIMKGNKVLASDKLGGVELEEKDIFSIVRKNISPEETNNDFMQISKVPVTDANGPIICGRYLRGVYDPVDSVSYMLPDRGGTIVKCGPDGIVTDAFYTSEMLGKGTDMSWGLFEAGKDSLMVSFMDEDYEWQCIVFAKKSHSLVYSVNINKGFDDDNLFEFAYSQGSFYTVVQNVTDTATRLHWEKPFARLRDGAVEKFGRYEEVFQKSNLTGIFRGVFAFDKGGNIITYQKHRANIQVYDKDLKFLKNIHLPFSNTAKFFPDGMELVNGSGHLKWAKFKNDYSWHEEMWCYDDKIYITYLNRTFPTGVYDEFSPKVKSQVYLHCSDMEGKNVYGRDLKLPQGFFFFRAIGDTVYGATSENNKLYLTVYKVRK